MLLQTSAAGPPASSESSHGREGIPKVAMVSRAKSRAVERLPRFVDGLSGGKVRRWRKFRTLRKLRNLRQGQISTIVSEPPPDIDLGTWRSRQELKSSDTK